MTRVTTTPTASQRIGCLLQDMRVQQRLTGEQLASMVGISQSRVSKIENGYSASIDADQIEKILKILKPSKFIRQQIVMLLFQLSGKMGPQYIYPFTDIPEVFNDLQKSTTLFRCYIVSGISGVLQTAQYRTAYLKKLGISDTKVNAELARTLERQDALWDSSKTFYLVMPEAALYTVPASPQAQITQLDRLERIMGSKTVHIGIIPTQAGLSFFETGTFTIYDDQVLYVFMGDRVVRLEDPESLPKYLNAFEELCSIASFNMEAMALIRKAADYFIGQS